MYIHDQDKTSLVIVTMQLVIPRITLVLTVIPAEPTLASYSGDLLDC